MQELVAQGVRITAQRRVLIETIQEAKGHIDAPTLLALARKRDASIDRATVYRTIDLLKRRGLIDELDLMHLTGEKHFYEVKTHRDHVHLACFRCGRIEELTTPLFEKLKGEMARQSGFEIQVVRLEVGGFCLACAKAGRREQK
jgi:Fur family ferric uptake transcriptional regulator